MTRGELAQNAEEEESIEAKQPVARKKAGAGKRKIAGSGKKTSAKKCGKRPRRTSAKKNGDSSSPREQVKNAMGQIIHSIVEKAKSGSTQHAKFLLEQYPEAEAETEAPDRKALTELLLDRL